MVVGWRGRSEAGAAGARDPAVRGRGRWLDTVQTIQGVAGGNFCIGVERAGKRSTVCSGTEEYTNFRLLGVGKKVVLGLIT